MLSCDFQGVSNDQIQCQGVSKCLLVSFQLFSRRVDFVLRRSTEYIADRPGGEPLLPPGMKEFLYED